MFAARVPRLVASLSGGYAENGLCSVAKLNALRENSIIPFFSSYPSCRCVQPYSTRKKRSVYGVFRRLNHSLHGVIFALADSARRTSNSTFDSISITSRLDVQASHPVLRRAVDMFEGAPVSLV